MIDGAHLRFRDLEPSSLDLPFGFKTGAAVIFGASGGVTEAVLRLAAEELGGERSDAPQFPVVRGSKGLLETELKVAGNTLRLAVVHGLKNAQELATAVLEGKAKYDLVEVMACPGGCVSGAGQPPTERSSRKARTRALHDADSMLQLHKSQDNTVLMQTIRELGGTGSEEAHRLLHTEHVHRRRIRGEGMSFSSIAEASGPPPLKISVCVGTSCYLKGAQDLLYGLIRHVRDRELDGLVDVEATFCFEQCDRGPTISVGGKLLHRCKLKDALEALETEMDERSIDVGKEFVATPPTGS